MRGRKPKPSALKRAAGNPGKRPINENEPRPPIPADPPYVPRHLNPDARREWRRIVRILIEIGLYTDIDRAALAGYCQAWGRWVAATRKLKETGGPVLKSDGGNYYQNPWLAVGNRAEVEMRKWLIEFGMTPSSRSRVVVAQDYEQLSLADILFQDIGDQEEKT